MGAYKCDVVVVNKMGAYFHGVLVLCGCYHPDLTATNFMGFKVNGSSLLTLLLSFLCTTRSSDCVDCSTCLLFALLFGLLCNLPVMLCGLSEVVIMYMVQRQNN